MSKEKGFTLLEMAVVLTIIAFMLGSVFMPMSAQRESNYIQQAREELKDIEEAIYGYAIANDRLPCPAQPGTAGLASPTTSGNCTSGIGFVPAATLGFNGKVNCDGLLLDPWNNPYRYSITTNNSGGLPTADFTTINDTSLVTPAGLNPNLQICTDNTCGANLTTRAVAVIFSMGKNWLNVVSADETENAGETTRASTCGLPAYDVGNNNNYVSRDRVEIVGSEYDDILIWISENILYAKLLAAGQLP
ncbi:MAG: type II secretion system GspH family protein [Gammaproteobacteria bacterium]|nr:type II secretion system GspH family protein [Gammaproteobacteria bacterium]